ncbi:hypothetical protein PLESTF_000833000 [Pleodorina starrii]|nr:hypothetical protein PLESTM_000899800 [Pleodorina starrii]GLC69459.1 hypothetical protein PLESTF_000833000 [Pleodorina starrii]
MRLLGHGSRSARVARNHWRVRAINAGPFHVRWPRQHLLGVVPSASRRKDPGASARRPRPRRSSDDDDSDDDDDDDGGAGIASQLYDPSGLGAADADSDPDAAALANFVRAQQLAAMRRARLSAAADATAAARVRDAGLQEYLASQGLGSISQFREMAEEEGQRTLEELQAADLAALKAQVAAAGGDLEADWAALEGSRSTTGLAKSAPGVRTGAKGAPLPEDALLAPPSNPRVDRLRSRSQQMRRKRRLFDPADGAEADGSLYDEPYSGSDSDDGFDTFDDYSSSSFRQQPSAAAGGPVLMRRPGAAGAPPPPPLPPKPSNPFLTLPRRPSDVGEDAEAILERMIDQDLESVQRQLRAASGSADADGDLYDDDGYDEYGNLRPGAVAPGAENDEYGDRMLRALRGALGGQPGAGGAGAEGGLVARPARPGAPRAGGRRPSGGGGGGAAAARLAAAPPDDYDALAELLESVGGELEQQQGGAGLGGLWDDEEEEEQAEGDPRVGGSSGSGSKRRPVTTTELLRSQAPSAASGPAKPQLLGRPAAAAQSPPDGARPKAAAGAGSGSAARQRAPGVGAFSGSDAELLEELLSDASFSDSPSRPRKPLTEASLDDYLDDDDDDGGGGGGPLSLPGTSASPRLPSLESKPTPRSRNPAAGSAPAAAAGRSGSSRSSSLPGAAPPRGTSAASLARARRDQEELMRDDWDELLQEDLLGLDEQRTGWGRREDGEGDDDGGNGRGAGRGSAAAAPQLLAKPSKQEAGSGGAGAVRGGKAGGGRAASAQMDLDEVLRGLLEDEEEGDARVDDDEEEDWDVGPRGEGGWEAAAPAPVVALARPVRGGGGGGGGAAVRKAGAAAFSGGGGGGGSGQMRGPGAAGTAAGAAPAGAAPGAAAAGGKETGSGGRPAAAKAEVRLERVARGKEAAKGGEEAAAATEAGAPPPEASAAVSAAAAPAVQVQVPAAAAAVEGASAAVEGAAAGGGGGGGGGRKAASMEEALAVLNSPERAAALARLEGRPQLSAPPPRNSNSSSSSRGSGSVRSSESSSSSKPAPSPAAAAPSPRAAVTAPSPPAQGGSGGRGTSWPPQRPQPSASRPGPGPSTGGSSTGGSTPASESPRAPAPGPAPTAAAAAAVSSSGGDSAELLGELLAEATFLADTNSIDGKPSQQRTPPGQPLEETAAPPPPPPPLPPPPPPPGGSARVEAPAASSRAADAAPPPVAAAANAPPAPIAPAPAPSASSSSSSSSSPSGPAAATTMEEPPKASPPPPPPPRSPRELEEAAAAAAGALRGSDRAGRLRSFRPAGLDAAPPAPPLAPTRPARPAAVAVPPPPPALVQAVRPAWKPLPGSWGSSPAAPSDAADARRFGSTSSDSGGASAARPDGSTRDREGASAGQGPRGPGDVAAAGPASSLSKVARSWTRAPAVRPWRPGAAPLPPPPPAGPPGAVGSEGLKLAAAAAGAGAAAAAAVAGGGRNPPATPADGAAAAAAAAETPAVPGFRQVVWDAALGRLDGPSASRSRSAAAAAAAAAAAQPQPSEPGSVAATSGTEPAPHPQATEVLANAQNQTQTQSQASRSTSSEMSFLQRLRRLRQMVLRGELLVGRTAGPYDPAADALPVTFPALERLGVAQPVRLPADRLLSYRLKNWDKHGGGSMSVWAAVTAVRAAEPAAGGAAAAAAGDGPTAAATAAMAAVSEDAPPPAGDLVVEVMEVVAPGRERWSELPGTTYITRAKERLLDLTTAVQARVVAVTDRGAYGEIQCRVPSRPPGEGEGETQRPAAAAAAPTQTDAAEAVAEAGPAAVIDGPDVVSSGPTEGTMRVPQLCFMPRECMAPRLAKEWPKVVKLEKMYRRRKVMEYTRTQAGSSQAATTATTAASPAESVSTPTPTPRYSPTSSPFPFHLDHRAWWSLRRRMTDLLGLGGLLWGCIGGTYFLPGVRLLLVSLRQGSHVASSKLWRALDLEEEEVVEEEVREEVGSGAASSAEGGEAAAGGSGASEGAAAAAQTSRTTRSEVPFGWRLRRARQMVLRGELLVGRTAGPYDPAADALPVIFPALERLGVAQPVRLPAERLLSYRLKNWDKHGGSSMSVWAAVTAVRAAEPGGGGAAAAAAGDGPTAAATAAMAAEDAPPPPPPEDLVVEVMEVGSSLERQSVSLARLRLMILRGELTEGYLTGAYDPVRHAVAANLPGLAKLGVCQPVWIPADSRRTRRKDPDFTAAAAAADAAVATVVGSRAAAGEGKREGGAAAGGGGGGAPQPWVKIWVSVTAVRVLSAAERDAAKSAGVQPRGKTAFVVQVAEAVKPSMRLWASENWVTRGSANDKRTEVIQSNVGRRVTAHLVGLTERGLYCEVRLQMEAEAEAATQLSRFGRQYGSGGREPQVQQEQQQQQQQQQQEEGRSGTSGKGPAGGAVAAAAAAAAADDAAEGSGSGSGRGQLVWQLCFLPRECMAPRLAAVWSEIVEAHKDYRARANAAITRDQALRRRLYRRSYGPATASAAVGPNMWVGDVVEAIVDGATGCLEPLGVVVALLRQVPHTPGPELLRALDMGEGGGPEEGGRDRGGTPDRGTAAADRRELPPAQAQPLPLPALLPRPTPRGVRTAASASFVRSKLLAEYLSKGRADPVAAEVARARKLLKERRRKAAKRAARDAKRAAKRAAKAAKADGA